MKLKTKSAPATIIDGIEIYVRDIDNILSQMAGTPLSAMPPLIQARLLVELSTMKAAAERMLTMCLEHTTENDV